MTTKIYAQRWQGQYDPYLVVDCADLNICFVCSPSDFNKRHNGIWNSKVMSFVPELIFSDGTPVDDAYVDGSGTYFDACQVCHILTNGNRYCGPSCEQQDTEGGL